jgi:hypothetical protein
LGLFSIKPPIDLDEFEWLLACFAWLKNELKRASGDDFVPGHLSPDQASFRQARTAQELFDAVKALAGLSDWHCELEQGEARRAPPATTLAGAWSEKFALGTFSVEGNTPVIRYDPELLRNPDALIATFAHELAHLLVRSLGVPPGGGALEEHATDCAAVYLGFGLFLANSARQFEQFQDLGMHGWRSSSSGYLSEGALATATAIQLRLFGHSEQPSRQALKPYLAKDFSKALRYIDKRFEDLPAEMDTLDYSEWLGEDGLGKDERHVANGEFRG